MEGLWGSESERVRRRRQGKGALGSVGLVSVPAASVFVLVLGTTVAVSLAPSRPSPSAPSPDF